MWPRSKRKTTPACHCTLCRAACSPVPCELRRSSSVPTPIASCAGVRKQPRDKLHPLHHFRCSRSTSSCQIHQSPHCHDPNSDYDLDANFLSLLSTHLSAPLHLTNGLLLPILYFPFSSTSSLRLRQPFVLPLSPCPWGLSPVLYMTHS
jgi:hypothetical protein